MNMALIRNEKVLNGAISIWYLIRFCFEILYIYMFD